MEKHFNALNRIKNPMPRVQKGDFRFSIYSFFSMLGIFAVFAGMQWLIAGGVNLEIIIRGSIALAAAALVYLLLPRWSALILVIIISQGIALVPLPREVLSALPSGAGASPGPWDGIALAGLVLAVLSGPSVQLIFQWEKAVVLRLGKFHRVRDPGIFLLVPVMDRCTAFVDTRIRVTDFSVEKILTSDTVPVHVDALAFWMIWDPGRAILEVEDYISAVTLSAQAALRDSIGKYSLTTLLSERDTLYREIQTILDAKTNPWGITILSVEFTDIILPDDLQDVMSKKAQAEREKEARLYLAQAEYDIAVEMSRASRQYNGDSEALNLRAMNMVYDSMKTRGSMVMLPSGVLERMNMGTTLGVSAFAESAMKDGDSPAEHEDPVTAEPQSDTNNQNKRDTPQERDPGRKS
ncbi:slipin family protein [Salinispira pacifica]|uniref:Putative membrane protease n=1 Tax=Salinispira pacifica TaxID=1307761 RepID=V5WIY6_9SPIO|nr:slipin family protein [Salinispira pacifica]AHC15580.1 Putative membrane protease [Salinispira pacifica]